MTVTTAGGTSATGSADRYTYETAPANTVPPELTGTGCMGRTVTCSSGMWSGSPAPTLTYQWLRNGVAISDATQNSYTVRTADCGHRLSCTVTATKLRPRVGDQHQPPRGHTHGGASRLSEGREARQERHAERDGEKLRRPHRVVRIYRRLGTKLTLLKRLTISSSGSLPLDHEGQKTGKWVLVASYKVGSLTVRSKAVTVTVRR